MKQYLYIPILILAGSCAVSNSGKKDSKKETPVAAVAPKPAPVQPAAPPPVSRRSKSGVKDYNSVVTKNLITQKGLFTVHSTREKDTVFFEIDKNLLNREILVINKIKRVGGVQKLFPGEIIDNTTILFEKGDNDVLQIRMPVYVNRANPSDAINKSVEASGVYPILTSFPIKAYGKDSSSIVIDVSKYLIDAKSVVNTGNANAEAKKVLDFASLKEHQILSIDVLPENVNIAITKNGFGRSPGSLASILETSSSFVMLPEVPLKLRAVDTRVGYQFQTFTEFSDAQQRVEKSNYINRWRLEPKAGEMQKYLAGELVEPAKPIVFYIDPATPVQWRKYMKAGVEDWNAAFEQAGFKNAIVAKVWPENDPSMSLNDVRHSFINYYPSAQQTASGPSVIDPRSGEIIQANVNWHHAYTEKLRQSYIIQAGVNNPNVKSMQLDEATMGSLIRSAVSHEIGHAIGLSNNYGSSSSVPVDSLRSASYLRKHGITPSVMDNSRYNYVAQPEDKIPADLLVSRVGEYDKWAIEFGYRILPTQTMEEEQLALMKLTSKRLAANSRLWFGDGELFPVDPRNQEDDLGDDATRASRLGIKNLKRVMGNLKKWSSSEIGQREELNAMYKYVTAQYQNYVTHVVKNIAAVNHTIRESGDKRPSFESVPRTKQLAALKFLNDEVFTAPTWLADPALINMIATPTENAPVENVLVMTVNSMLDGKRLNYILMLERRFGANNTIGIMEYLASLRKGIWGDLESGNVTIDSYHRLMQNTYIGALYKIMTNNAPSIAESEASSIAGGEIRNLEAKIKAAKSRTTDPVSKAHLVSLEDRIAAFYR